MDLKKAIKSQLDEWPVEYGDRMVDEASGFQGVVTAIFFYQHGCMRINLRGRSLTTGEPLECTFDAPELKLVSDDMRDKGDRPAHTGGPHSLTPPSRP